MSTKTNDGGPTAASMIPGNDGSVVSVGGLSKREYFAAMAMQGILNNAEAFSNMSEGDVATNSCAAADALLEALHTEVEP